MNQHSTAVSAIEDALGNIPGHHRPEFAEGLAEGLIIAHFASGHIDSDEFKHYCERLRRIAQGRTGARMAA